MGVCKTITLALSLLLVSGSILCLIFGIFTIFELEFVRSQAGLVPANCTVLESPIVAVIGTTLRMTWLVELNSTLLPFPVETQLVERFSLSSSSSLDDFGRTARQVPYFESTYNNGTHRCWFAPDNSTAMTWEVYDPDGEQKYVTALIICWLVVALSIIFFGAQCFWFLELHLMIYGDTPFHLTVLGEFQSV